MEKRDAEITRNTYKRAMRNFHKNLDIFDCSQRRCGLRDLRQVRRGADGPAGVVRRPSDGRPGGPNDRPFGTEELRAAAARAVTVVGCLGRLCRLHDIRDHVQSDAPRLSMTRGQLRVRPAEAHVTRS